MIKRAWAAVAALALSSAAIAQPADDRSEAVAAWKTLAETDLSAAYELIRGSHPAAAPELDDTGFQAQLEESYALARSRIDKVEGFNGYRAVLTGFANGLGDKHIWSRAQLSRPAYYTASFVPALRGGRWTVAEDLWVGDGGSLQGAELISCDGKPVADLARERLGGFRAVWSIAAQRIAAAPWLFVRDNPLLPAPDTCLFVKDGASTERKIVWGGIEADKLHSAIAAAVKSGKAGMGVRPFHGGHWIGLESLSPDAAAVVQQVQAQAAELRRSPLVVLDMRGNSGGNSLYGRQIAEILYGQAEVRRRLDAVGGKSCGSPWRASPGNLATIEEMIEQGAGSGMNLAAVRDAMKTAIAEGRAFTGPVSCAATAGSTGQERPLPPPANAPKVVLLTDHVCFSSCLLVTGTFRTLGALHVGEGTDAATRYMEVREIVLPSQISTFSTLQKVALSEPAQIGPFEPHRLFGGAMDNTEALESWIMEVAGE